MTASRPGSDRFEGSPPNDSSSTPTNLTASALAPQRVLEPPDFARPMVAILGMPFDVVTLAEAARTIRSAAASGKRCFVSTPNLNFAIAARHDPAFRDSVLHSDLILVDGMPLVWIARWLGLPITERVSGADVFQALQRDGSPALPVYLFGAPRGAAARASSRINANVGGIVCVGFDEGGFGSVESLSTDAHIERINASGAAFVVVSLGAKKGQAWIEHNAARLSAPVLAHLGAVVNFAAGSVARAPRWMQAAGLEWAWRVKEEPALWRRYAGDAAAAAALLVGRVLPDACASAIERTRPCEALQVTTSVNASTTTIALQGSSRGDLSALQGALASCAAARSGVVLDLMNLTDVSASFVALALIVEGWFRERGGFALVGAKPSAAAALRRKMAKDLL